MLKCSRVIQHYNFPVQHRRSMLASIDCTYVCERRALNFEMNSCWGHGQHTQAIGHCKQPRHAPQQLPYTMWHGSMIERGQLQQAVERTEVMAKVTRL